MAVISFVNPKGGAGKSTSCLILGQELLRRGERVSIIECDPLMWIDKWSDINCEACENMTVSSILDPERLPAAVTTERRENDFVLIDTEGSKNLAVAQAILMSNLVIIPIQPSAMDSEAASEAINLIRSQELTIGRKIESVVLFNRTNAAIRTRSKRAIEEELATASIPALRTELVERSAFRELFSFGGDLADLPQSEVNGVQKALTNSEQYGTEVLSYIQKVLINAS